VDPPLLDSASIELKRRPHDPTRKARRAVAYLRRLVRRTVSRFWPRDQSSAQLRGIVAHPLVKGLPRVSLASQPPTDHPDRLPIARRLIRAYGLTKAAEVRARLVKPQDDLWTQLIDAELEQLLRLLSSEDAVALSKYLRDFGEHYTWFGGLTLSLDGFTQHRDHSSIAAIYLDKLVCLAESIGALSLENPEQSVNWGSNLYAGVDELLDAVERMIGIAVVPRVTAVPVTGIATRHGLLHYRHLNSLYAALRIQSLVRVGSAACEYGGGLGLVAYYANKLGLPDYTLFDLPLTNVFSGHFLMNTLGADAVRLYGEEPQREAVKILPYWECAVEPADRYSLALNQDSFPEIDPDAVLEYFRQIERTSVDYFLSINQEAQASMGTRRQNSVPNLLRGDSGFQRVYRMKYWLREGYVEELYRLRRKSDGPPEGPRDRR